MDEILLAVPPIRDLTERAGLGDMGDGPFVESSGPKSGPKRLDRRGRLGDNSGKVNSKAVKAKGFGVFVAAALVGLVSPGCRTGVSGGRPPALDFQGKLVASLNDKYSKPGAIPEDETKMTEEKRNEILNDLIYLTDVNYYKFTSGLYQGRAFFDTASDLAILGLGAAGALAPGASVKAILAAISGGIGGSRVSINKNFFHEQTTTALIAKMEAARKARLALMQEAMSKLSVRDYPLSRGLAQVAEYYNAGTVVGALQDIVATAGEEKAKANADLKETINLTYGADNNTALLRDFWQSNREKNGPVLEKWMSDHSITVSIPSFLRAKEYAAQRAEAVKELIKK